MKNLLLGWLLKPKYSVSVIDKIIFCLELLALTAPIAYIYLGKNAFPALCTLLMFVGIMHAL